MFAFIVCLLFTLFVYPLFSFNFSKGLRRRYGDKSLQTDGAIQLLKDMIPQVEILQIPFCFILFSSLCFDLLLLLLLLFLLLVLFLSLMTSKALFYHFRLLRSSLICTTVMSWWKCCLWSGLGKSDLSA